MFADRQQLPFWDDLRGILFFGAIAIVKQFDKPAENQRMILRAFQAAGWPVWIANPLEPDGETDDRQRLADAVYKLNRHQKTSLIRFRRDGSVSSYWWR